MLPTVRQLAYKANNNCAIALVTKFRKNNKFLFENTLTNVKLPTVRQHRGHRTAATTISDLRRLRRRGFFFLTATPVSRYSPIFEEGDYG
jgi:hypothetical protein